MHESAVSSIQSPESSPFRKAREPVNRRILRPAILSAPLLFLMSTSATAGVSIPSSDSNPDPELMEISTLRQQGAVQEALLIGVLELKANNIDTAEAAAITERLRIYLARQDIFTMLERAEMVKILEEQGFQQAGGCIDDEECIVQAGRLLGVKKMVAGSVSRVGSTYTLMVRMIDMETARIEETALADVNTVDELLTSASRNVAEQLATAVSGQAPPAEPVRQPEQQREAEQPPQQTQPQTPPTGRRGSWMMVNGGFGSINSTTTTTTGIDLAIYGGGSSLQFAYGRYLGQRVVFFTQIFSNSVPGPTFEVGGMAADAAEDETASIGGFGFGMTFYLSPDGWYISPALAIAKLSLDLQSGSVETNSGAGLNLLLGRELRLSDRASLGLNLHLFTGSMEDSDGSSTWKSTAFGLTFALILKGVRR